MRRLRGAQRPDPAPGDRIRIVSIVDHLTHVVQQDVYGTALVERAGACPAVCGHRVVFAAMITPFGPCCRACAAGE